MYGMKTCDKIEEALVNNMCSQIIIIMDGANQNKNNRNPFGQIVE
jgi:hypothetical protein